jgi:general secretion pathway protein D
MAAQIGLKYGLEGGAITTNGLYSLASNMGAKALQMSPELLGFLNTNNTTTTYQNGNPIQETNPAFKIDGNTNKVFALGAQLSLLENNGAAQLLSEPSVLCTNNKESSIYVGQTMSILTQGQQSTSGVSNIVNNYSREDIGLTLTVQPRLSSNNQVSLEIEVKVEDLDPSSEQIADRPTTTKRTVKTNAIVKNGETIILGGLIKKVSGTGQSKVPFFSEIPVLGNLLFTHDSDVERQQNVIIYLTPYIVRSSSDLQKLKLLLAELDHVQDQYNKIVLENLEDRGGAFTSKGSASGRIRHSPDVYRGPAPVVVENPSMGSRGPIYNTPAPAVNAPVAVPQTTTVPTPTPKKQNASSRIISPNTSSTLEVASADVEEEGFFSSLFSSAKKEENKESATRGSRGYYNPDFGDE